MAGNVWEWTSSRWGANPEIPDVTYDAESFSATSKSLAPTPAEEIYMIVRGGSWSHRQQTVRATNRSRFLATGIDSDRGFRVATSFRANQGLNQETNEDFLLLGFEWVEVPV